MKAGAYQYLIELYHRETKLNDYGEEVESYVLVRKTRAAINFRSKSRELGLMEERMPGTYEMIVRSYVEVDDTSRVKWQGKTYRVIEWHEDLQYRDKVITVEEVNE